MYLVFNCIRIGLGCVFLWSSFGKIRHPYLFLSSVYDYGLTSAELGVFVAITLGWFELVLGLCLISGILVRGSLMGSALLMGAFVFVQGSALWRGLAISCGCFAQSGAGLITYGTLLRTCALFVASVVACCALVYFRLSPNHEGVSTAVTASTKPDTR